jgi:hypothetical protein
VYTFISSFNLPFGSQDEMSFLKCKQGSLSAVERIKK